MHYLGIPGLKLKKGTRLKEKVKLPESELTGVRVVRSAQITEGVDEVGALVAVHLSARAQLREQLQRLPAHLILPSRRHFPAASS